MEILVADNASPDNTQSVLAAFNDRRLRYWRQRTNVGVERNILSLLKAAQGKWIFCITDDDYVLPGGLERLISVSRDDESLGVILSDTQVVDIEGNHLRIDKSHDRSQRFTAGLDALLGLVAPSHVLSRVMIRREWIDFAGVEGGIGSLYPQMAAVASVVREHAGVYLAECSVAHTTGNATDWNYPTDFMVGARISAIKSILPTPRWRVEREALLDQLRDEIVSHHVSMSVAKSIPAFLAHQFALLINPEIAFSGRYWRRVLYLLASASWRRLMAGRIR